MSDLRNEMAADVTELMDRVLAAARLDLKSVCEVGEEEVRVDLQGSDSHLVLRENARLLYALNHLVSQFFFRRARGRYAFVVDCEEYRGTRVMELQLLARKAAERVRATGQPFRLQPMPASERRVIHLTLSEESGVRSGSEGSGEHRRVVIEREGSGRP